MTTPFDVVSAEKIPVRLPLIEPFVIAYATYTHTESILVRLTLRNGVTGWGESTPDEAVTGETPERVLADLCDALAPALIGIDARRIDAAINQLTTLRPSSPTAVASLDIALHDAIGRSCGLPVWALIGGRPPGPLTISRVVSIAAPEAMADAARRHVAAGFRTIKLKVGDAADPELDARRILAVREAVGDGIGLKVDVNQGWRTPAIAIRGINASRDARVDYYEQPIDRHDLDGLAEVRRATGAPIMADEACQSPADALRAAQLGAADFINIKLMKSGGLHNAIAIDAIANAAGIGTQVGTMVESSIASAAGLHLAAARSNVRFVEMGGPLMHAEDVGDIRTWYHRDQITLPDAPGLGITVDDRQVDRLAVDRMVIT
jgi:L-alanine-DL-glutamate epimerase-like enolase superfamily enzyme